MVFAPFLLAADILVQARDFFIWTQMKSKSKHIQIAILFYFVPFRNVNSHYIDEGEKNTEISWIAFVTPESLVGASMNSFGVSA